jgi:hypothetical protein
MQQDDTSSNSSTSSSLSGDSSSADSDTGSDSDSEADNDTAGHAGLGFDTSLPVVVDASGKPRQHWHELSLQERYPVQARHEQTPRSPAVDGSSGGSKSSRQRQQRGPRPRDVLIDNISTSMLLANRTGSMPEFQSDDITAAVAAATTAAADVAKQQVAQYAELAQQLQQAQQNPNKRPGSRGRGVKKQLKKAKVAAKRNAREARTEAGALQLLSAFEVFAGSGQDMQVLPPCGSRQKEVGGAWRQLHKGLWDAPACSRVEQAAWILQVLEMYCISNNLPSPERLSSPITPRCQPCGEFH